MTMRTLADFVIAWFPYLLVHYYVFMGTLVVLVVVDVVRGADEEDALWDGK